MSVDGINLALGNPAKHPEPDITVHQRHDRHKVFDT
jgi:hypothetical protein